MIAITVAYRDRREHLEKFAPYMHDYLGDKDYRIYLIEQEPGKKFNRGKLFNVGFDLLSVRHHTFFFHDVDMLPRDATYEVVEQPTHFVGYASQFEGFGGRPYEDYFGGVTAMNCDDFERVNGYSNEYWGWGAEDDDLRERVHKEGLEIDWRDNSFESLSHPKPYKEHDGLEDSRRRLRAFADGRGYDHQSEGLNTVDYEVLESEHVFDCQKITVSI